MRRYRKSMSAWLAIIAVLCALSTTVAAADKQKAVVLFSGVVLYASASKSSDVVATLAQGSEVTVLKEVGKFYFVNYGKNEGYIDGNCLRLRGIAEPVEGKGIINANEVNLRLKPTLDAQIVVVLKKGATVGISAMIDNWYEVSTGKSKGYVHADYVDVAQGSLVKATYSTLRMGMTGQDVVRLQEALKALNLYKGTVSGCFGALTREAVKAYEQNKGLKVDGIAGDELLQLLYAEVYSLNA